MSCLLAIHCMVPSLAREAPELDGPGGNKPPLGLLAAGRGSTGRKVMAHQTAVISTSVLATMLRPSSCSDSVNFTTALEDYAMLLLKSVEACTICRASTLRSPRTCAISHFEFSVADRVCIAENFSMRSPSLSPIVERFLLVEICCLLFAAMVVDTWEGMSRSCWISPMSRCCWNLLRTHCRSSSRGKELGCWPKTEQSPGEGMEISWSQNSGRTSLRKTPPHLVELLGSLWG